MKLAEVRVPQYLYSYADNRSADILELQPGNIILYDDEFCCTFSQDTDDFEGPEILRSWIAIFEGHVGWISCWDEEKPTGIKEFAEFAT